MTNTEALNQRILCSGIKKGKIAETLGISKVSLSNKIHNRTQFKQSEIGKLVSMLGIQDPDERDNIFFGEMLKNVEHYSTPNLTEDNVFKENAHGEYGIGQLIRRRRKEIRMSQRDLAKSVGVKKETISRYESNDIAGIPPEKIVAICKALDTSPNYLFGWDEPSNTN